MGSMKTTPRFTAVVAIVLAMACMRPAAAAAAQSGELIQAARARDVETVRVLLKRGSDANTAQEDGATALHWAAHWNETAIADALVAHGARVNQANEYGATPLWLAAVNGSAPMTS